ncbi:MAG: hypothetical protein COB78_08565 [Hyphomicrobiales bacterium]|nr:MAG: hypothetical protein COB78_08565 [Hyphomicrobiales bacterium]
MKSGDQSAIERFKQHHPKSATLLPSDIVEILPRLSEAQLVIARELGLPSWAKLKAHAETMEAAGQAILNNEQSPDAGFKTLHIRCGDDIRQTLPDAGFVGDFLKYSDPYCQGPVIDGPDFYTIRAEFLSTSYGMHSSEETLTGLQEEQDNLASAAQEYERVVLWFEHDSYDQLILIKILSLFAQTGLPKKLEMIDLNHFPGSIRFLGLGQLPPEAMRMLWSRRKPVTAQQLSLGTKAWDALLSTKPVALERIALSKNLALPNLSNALQRHLQEFPSTFNGLGLTEKFILEILNDENKTTGEIFRVLMSEKEPLPWLGDVMYWRILKSMTEVSTAVLEVVSQNGHPGTPEEPLAGKCDWLTDKPQRQMAITEKGRDVLAGKVDYLSLNPPERWLGGVKIDPQHPCWRWDDHAQKMVLVT